MKPQWDLSTLKDKDREKKAGTNMAVTHADICIGNELENSFETPKHIII
jgi:hypothetical protein